MTATRGERALPEVGGAVRAVAAVTPSAGQPFALTDVTLDNLRDDEVLVKIRAAGICHSDLVFIDGHHPAPFPLVLGHEGAGEIISIGSQVRGLNIGDRVALSFSSCAECRACLAGQPAYCRWFRELNLGFQLRADGAPSILSAEGPVSGGFFGQSSFATHSLTHARNVVRIPADMPYELAAPLGCGVQTGAGAVLNTLKVGAGSHLVIFGAGAVGMSALMAARICGAMTSVVEPVASRRELALELGATHAFDPRHQDLAGALSTAAPDGFDYAIDTTGRSDVHLSAIEALHSRGSLALIGSAPSGTQFQVPLMHLLIGRKVLGLVEGDAVPQLFIPLLAQQWAAGRFPLDKLVQTYSMADISAAAEDMRNGTVIKPVLLMA